MEGIWRGGAGVSLQERTQISGWCIVHGDLNVPSRRSHRYSTAQAPVLAHGAQLSFRHTAYNLGHPGAEEQRSGRQKVSEKGSWGQ